MSFFLVEKLSIIVKKFSKCLKNGKDRLRKGKLRRRTNTDIRFLVQEAQNIAVLWLQTLGKMELFWSIIFFHY